MDTDARARAEARRQKILARQKDRLSTITGVYQDATIPPSDSAQETSSASAPRSDQSTTSAAGATNSPTTTPTAGQQSATAQEQSQISEQQMAALLAAATASLQRAQSASDTPGVGNAQQFQQDMLQNILRGSLPADLGPHAAEQEQMQTQGQQMQQQVAWVMKLGPLLATAVKQTQPIRLLSALLLAYAVLSGWDTGMPPAVFVIVTDFLILASAIVVFSSTSYGQQVAAADAVKAAEGTEVRVPMRLRSFDFITLVPGLREVLNVFSGYRLFAKALSEDVAVYIVGLGMTMLLISSGVVK